MGIDVVNNSDVVFNGSHDDLVITCPSKNPTLAIINGMDVQSIFRRVKSKNRSGDGNPLIYALKRKKGFRISSREIVRFLPDFQSILSTALRDKRFDMVIPMPSSYPISRILASRAVRTIGLGSIKHNYLRKKNNGEVLAELHRDTIPKEHSSLASSLRKKLEKSDSGASFSMKDVDLQLRPFIQPLALTCDSGLSPERKMI